MAEITIDTATWEAEVRSAETQMGLGAHLAAERVMKLKERCRDALMVLAVPGRAPAWEEVESAAQAVAGRVEWVLKAARSAAADARHLGKARRALADLQASAEAVDARHTFRCCSKACPGYPYPAAARAHPLSTCGPEPQAATERG